MGATKASVPPGIEREVEWLVKSGVAVELAFHGGQCFVMVRSLATPAPPWGASSHDILIAVPLAYETAGLDAFYLRKPYSFQGGTHPRVSGATVQLADATWQLVSWHYAKDKSWIAGQDSLASHIEHCRGFFLNRNAINAI
jgi:hypothetical protein